MGGKGVGATRLVRHGDSGDSWDDWEDDEGVERSQDSPVSSPTNIPEGAARRSGASDGEQGVGTGSRGNGEDAAADVAADIAADAEEDADEGTSLLSLCLDEMGELSRHLIEGSHSFGTHGHSNELRPNLRLCRPADLLRKITELILPQVRRRGRERDRQGRGAKRDRDRKREKVCVCVWEGYHF